MSVDGAFWSLYARCYDLIWDSPLTHLVTTAAASGIPAAGVAVDLGCGTGLSSRVLTDSGRAVIGVDRSPRMLARALTSGRIARAVQADAAATGLPSGSAAVVLAVNVLHVHPDPEGLLAEIRRIAAPGARIALVWPDDDVDHDRLNAAELRLGRATASVLRADALRRTIGLPGRLAGVPRHRMDRLTEAVARYTRAAEFTVLRSATVHGCQHLLQLERTTPSQTPERISPLQNGMTT